jgi:phage terminase small subunit
VSDNTKNAATKKPKKFGVSSRRRAVFVEEYLRTLNATQSAIKAGYSPSGARTQGHRMLADPDIKAEIQQALSERHEQCMVDVEFILQGLKDIALDTNAPVKDRVKAYDLLGRYKTMWTGGEDKTPNQKVEIVFKDTK